MNISKLRFQGFESDWKSYKLGSLISTLKSGLSRQLNSYDIGIPVLRANNIQNGNLDFNDIKYWYIDDPQGANTLSYLVQPGDLLINFINSEAKMGTTAFVKKPLSRDMIYTTNILRMTTNEKLINYFFHLYSQTHRYKNYIKVITKPAVNQASFTTVDFKAMDLTIPHIEEQQRIVEFFTLLEQRIENQREKVKLLKAQKKGLLQKILRQELRFKDDDGGEFPEWNSFLFGNVVSNKSDKVNPEDGSDLNMCIELENIESGSGRIIKETNYVDQTSMKNKFSTGSVLFGKLRPYLKKFWFSNSEGMCSTEIWVLSPRVLKLKKKYLYYFIQTEYFMEFANKSSGSKMPRADWNIISNMKFKIPSLKEQQKISDFFSTLDSKIENENNKIESLKNQKKGFMQQMFI